MKKVIIAVLFALLCSYIPIPHAKAQQNCSPDHLGELLQLEDFVNSPIGIAFTTVTDDPTLDQLANSYRDLSLLRIEIENEWETIVDCSASHRDMVMNYLQLLAVSEDLVVLKILEMNGVISSDVFNERVEPIRDRMSEKLDGVMQYVTAE
jgi:hypothetical protein